MSYEYFIWFLYPFEWKSVFISDNWFENILNVSPENNEKLYKWMVNDWCIRNN